MPEADAPGSRIATLFRAAPIVPGLVLTASLAVIALALRNLPGMAMFSPMILAMLLGMGVKNSVGAPAWLKPGIVFSLKRVLRAAIVLLGLQLTLTQVADVGARGLAVILLTVAASFAFTVWAARLLGVDRKLAELIATGTAICGASAVIAANTVTRTSEEDVAYAVASVTIFGSLAVIVYPPLAAAIGLGPHAFGLWSGASIHEIAQVIAAAFQQGEAAGQTATVTKLTRVMLLAPLVLGLGFWAARRRGADASAAKAPIPWFVFGFIALVVINSLIAVPPEARRLIVLATSFMLALALAAMGLETDLRKLKAKGLRPLALGAAAWVFIAGFSLGLLKILY